MLKKLIKFVLRNVPFVGNVIKVKYESVTKKPLEAYVVRVNSCDGIISTTVAMSEKEFKECVDRVKLYSAPEQTSLPGTTKSLILTQQSTLKNQKPTQKPMMVLWIVPKEGSGRYLVMTLTAYNKFATRGESLKDKLPKQFGIWQKIALFIKDKFGIQL